MKWFADSMRRLRAYFGRESIPTERIVYTGATTAGQYISHDTAMKQAVVWACLTYLSRTVAQLPWRVLLPMAEGGAQHATTHPVHKLLQVRPNPNIGPFAFKETMVGWAAAYGNAIAEIEFSNRPGAISALWPIHPDRVEFHVDKETGRLVYMVRQDNGAVVQLSADRVFHLRGFGGAEVGLSVIAYAAESIGWARAAEVFGAAFFGQGMAPSGLLSLKSKLTPDGKAALEAEIARKFGGAKNAHRTLVLDFDAEFRRLAVDPALAQLVETRQHQVEEICRWFGVPPHKVMHLLRSTFSNIEHQSIEVVVDSITPWCLRLEEEADYKLFGANRAGYYTKLDLKGLLRGDYKSRQEGLQIMRRNGVISADEWRALEDMNPLPAGAGGDSYVIERNMTLLAKVGQDDEPARDDEDDLVDIARQQRAHASIERMH